MRLLKKDFWDESHWKFHRELVKGKYRVIDRVEGLGSVHITYRLGLVIEEFIVVYTADQPPKTYKLIAQSSSEKE